MPHVATSPADLLETLRAAAHLDGDRLVIDDERGLPRRRRSATSPGPRPSRPTTPTTEAAQWLVWEASQALGAPSASIQELYVARGRGEVVGLHGPGHQHPRPDLRHGPDALRGRRRRADVGAVILELARSEQTYTYQRPIDYATAVLAGAIAASWRAPVFIQGDHYQFNAKKYAADPEAMTEEIRRACRLAIDAGYRNIDIDSSTLVDLSKPTVDEQQRENYVRAAELTALIRSLETDGVTISVGGEIGEVGKKNSTVEELRAYLDGYRARARRPRPGAPGISKVSVQTGTSHGGVPLPGGGVAEVKLDFDVLRAAGRGRPRVRAGRAPSSTARRPCPTSCSTASRRSRPPRSTSRPGSRTRCTSTRRSPRSSRDEIEAWVLRRTPPTSARPTRPTSSSCTRRARRRSGRSSASCGTSTSKDEILAAQRRKFSFLFTELGVNGSREMVAAYIRPVEVHRPMPGSLREAVAAG